MGCGSSSHADGASILSAVVAHPIDDTYVIHSPAFTHGKTTKWTTRTFNSRASWKSKMQKYLQSLFEQLLSYDYGSLGLVVDKYFRVISGAGIPYRFINTNKRHANALKEIETLFAIRERAGNDNFIRNDICIQALTLLDIYAKQRRYEDFEEFVFILTIIINNPVIQRMETTW